MSIKGWRPFDLNKQYLIKYGLPTALIYRLVLRLNLPNKLLLNYNKAAKKDVSSLENGNVQKINNRELNFTAAIIGVVWYRGSLNNINPETSSIYLQDIFVPVKQLVNSIKENIWETGASLTKSWNHHQRINKALFLCAKEAKSRHLEYQREYSLVKSI